MRALRVLLVVATATVPAIGFAAGQGGVPLYTSDDLNRMFGPSPGRLSDPVDKSTPEDWRSVQQFLDREYARIDADHQRDLQRASSEPQRTRGEYDDWSFTGNLPWYPGYYPGYVAGYGSRMGWHAGLHSSSVPRGSRPNPGSHGVRSNPSHHGRR